MMLQGYLDAYAQLFQDGKVFPKPVAIIEATAAANNRNAIDASYSTYVREMNDYFASGYNDDREVAAHSRQLQAAALEKFDVVSGGHYHDHADCSSGLFPFNTSLLLLRRFLLQHANFGARSTIAEAREQLRQRMADEHAVYMTRNSERNPTRNMEVYVFAIAIGVAAWVLKMIADVVCAPWSDFCMRGSQFLGFVYTFVFVGELTIPSQRVLRATNRARILLLPAF